MSTLSADELAALRAELAGTAYADLSDAERFDALHRPSSQANPSPRGQVPKPFNYGDIKALLSSASQGNLKAVGFMPRVVDDINAMNRPGVVAWADLLLDGGTITQAEHDAIAALATATIPDPSWSATVPGPSPKRRLFGPKSWTQPDGSVIDFIPLADVSEAR